MSNIISSLIYFLHKIMLALVISEIDSSVYILSDTAICPAGQYAEDVTNVCKKCPRGYYQNSTGSRMCQSCPNGQMTLEDGATSEQSCRRMYCTYRDLMSCF